MTAVSDRLDAIDRRYSAALDAKPGKGPITRFDAIVDSVADVPYLLDLARKQQAAIDDVRALHSPINVYDECECPDGTHPEEYDYIDCEDYVGCENSFSHYACEVCCTANDYITEWCSDTHDHTTESGCLCPTIRALESKP